MSKGVPELELHENGYYYIHWTEGRRTRRCSTRQKNLAQAKIFLAQWLMMESREPEKSAPTLTVRDLWSVYWERHVEEKVVAKASLRSVWRNLEPHFGSLLPSQISDEVVRNFEARRRRGDFGRAVKSATVRRDLVVLRAMLHWCASPKRKLISPDEMPHFDLPEPGVARDRWLTSGEIRRLMDAARKLRLGDRLSKGERFLWLALETAARKTAICELTWDRVDFETRVIHYNVPGRALTKKRRSSTPISSTLLPILQRAYAERRNDYVLGSKANPFRMVARIAQEAGLSGVSPHVLRHTAATHMARRGVPLFHVAGVLGNTLAMTERVYAKHVPAALREAVETISGGVLEPTE